MATLSFLQKSKTLPNPLKGSSSIFERLSKIGAKVILLILLYAASLWLVVPFVVYALCAAKENFLNLVTSMTTYVTNYFFSGWAALHQFSQYQTPALIIVLADTALFIALAIYAYAQQTVSADLKQIFGPAASKTNEHGSARLICDERMLKGITRTWDGLWAHPLDNPSIVIGYSNTYKKYYVASDETHSVTFGMPGSGKTTSVNYATIDCLCAGGSSVVLTDPKGELYDATAADLREKFREKYCDDKDRVHIIDFRNTLRSESFNPVDIVWDSFDKHYQKHLQYSEAALQILESGTCIDIANADHKSSWVGDSIDAYDKYIENINFAKAEKELAWARAEEMAKDLSQAIIPEIPGSVGEHWETTGRMLLRGMILLVGTITDEDFVKKCDELAEPLREQRTLESVKRVLDFYGGSDGYGHRPLVDLMDCINQEHPAVTAFAQLKNASDRDYGTIVGEAQKFLDEYLGLAINQVMNKSDFDLGSFGTDQQILFVVLPDDRPATGKLFSILVTQMYQALVATATDIGKSLPVPVNFLCEEFGNLKVTIPDFASKLAMSRGYNIFFHLTLQGMYQLEENYGKSGIDNIIDKCATRILLSTNDEKGVGKYFSDSMGVYTYTASKVSKHRKTLGFIDESKNTSADEGERPLLYPDEVTRWNPEWGNIVLQKKPGKRPTLFAQLLGYKMMQPCVYPSEKAWNTPTAQNLNIGSKEFMQQKTAIAEKEVRLFTRTPNIPWQPFATNAQKGAMKKSLRSGGVSVSANTSLANYAVKKDIEREVISLLSSDEIKQLIDGQYLTDEDIERIVDVIEEKFEKASEQEALNAQSEYVDDPNYQKKMMVELERKKAKATSIVWKLATDALIEEDSIKAFFKLVQKRAKKLGQANTQSKQVAKELNKALPIKEDKKTKAEKNSEKELTTRKIKECVKAAFDKSATENDFVQACNDAGIDVVFNDDDKKIVYIASGVQLKASSIGRAYTYTSIKEKFANPSNKSADDKRSAKIKNVDESMRTYLKSQKYNTDKLFKEMNEKGVSFGAIYEKNPNFANWIANANRYECNADAFLEYLAKNYEIKAQKN